MSVVRARSEALPDRVLLIGWDAADWQVIRPLIDAGLMPTLKSLCLRGASGNLASMQPMLSPILWNSIATGRRPEAHGVLGFTEPVPDGPGVRPVASTSRRCKAIWNILTQQSMTSNVVGWYASHPAEPIRGVMVSNQLAFGRDEGALDPLPRGSVHPAELADALAECRVHPSEIDASAILPFIPDAARIADLPSSRIPKLQDLLAQTASVHALALRLMERDGWDLTAVYYEGIDRFGHEFMEFHPPKMRHVSDADFESYRHCMTGICRFHDMLLEALLDAAGERAAVLLVSDHGYWSDARRPDPSVAEPGPAEWHRPYGVFVAAGPGIRAGSEVHGAGLLDIAPTALALLGLPAAADMPGRVIVEALNGIDVPHRIQSWESVSGECGMHPPGMRIDAADARAALEQLVALGYVAPLSPDEDRAQRDTVSCNQFNLAQSCADARQHQRAIAALDTLEEGARTAPPALLLRAQCLLATGDTAGARSALSQVRHAGSAPAAMVMLGAAIDLHEGRVATAIDALQGLAGMDRPPRGAAAMLAQALAIAGRLDEAEPLLRAALAEEPEDPRALCAWAELLLARDDAEGSIAKGLAAAALCMDDPRVHFVLGRAFRAAGCAEDAVQALAACVALAPSWPEPRALLERIRMESGSHREGSGG
jgi:predicted AlkP superfamily phosphohydrolase/phosphomutase/tetratricopeptide (TPR) repeat protein